MAKRKCDFKKATWLAEQVVLKRKLAAEQNTEKLERAQLTLGLDEMPKAEPADKFVPDDPTVDF